MPREMTEDRVPTTRQEFERHRNCAHCGQRLAHSQYDDAGSTVFTKMCPQFDRHMLGGGHDFLEYRHDYPYRNRHGQNSDGTKNRMEARDD